MMLYPTDAFSIVKHMMPYPTDNSRPLTPSQRLAHKHAHLGRMIGGSKMVAGESDTSWGAVYSVVILAVFSHHLAYEWSQNKRQQEQQLKQDAFSYCERLARLGVFCVMLLLYQLGITVAGRTSPIGGMVTNAIALEVTYQFISIVVTTPKLKGVVNQESGSRLVSFVESFNVWTIIVSPRPRGTDFWQAFSHFGDYCRNTPQCSS